MAPSRCGIAAEVPEQGARCTLDPGVCAMPAVEATARLLGIEPRPRKGASHPARPSSQDRLGGDSEPEACGWGSEAEGAAMGALVKQNASTDGVGDWKAVGWKRGLRGEAEAAATLAGNSCTAAAAVRLSSQAGRQTGRAVHWVLTHTARTASLGALHQVLTWRQTAA